MLVSRFFFLLSCSTALILPRIGESAAKIPIEDFYLQTKTDSKEQTSTKSNINHSRKPPLQLSNKKYIKHENRIPYQYVVSIKSGLSDQEAQVHMNQVNKLQQSVVSKYQKSHPLFRATAKFKNAPSTGGIVESFNIPNKLRLYIGYFADDVVSELTKNVLVESVEQVPRPLKQQVEVPKSKSTFTSTLKSSKSGKSQNTIGKRSDPYPIFATQQNAPWHLTRINWLNPTEDSDFHYFQDAGKNVDIYVVDTGVSDVSDLSDLTTSTYNEGSSIVHGHGICVASVAAGKLYGVAKSARVTSLFLDLNEPDTYAVVLNRHLIKVGLSHLKNSKENDFQGSVINMSFEYLFCEQLEKLLQNLDSIGVHVVVAAGNFEEDDLDKDSCQIDPARSAFVLTVGAIDRNNRIADFSGRGNCVDLYAPGVDIMCASISGPANYVNQEGTSFAAPIVSGMIASILSYAPYAGSQFSGNNYLTPAVMRYLLVTMASSDRLPGSTPIAYLGDNKSTYNKAFESIFGSL